MVAMISIFVVMVFIGAAINVVSYSISIGAIRKSLDGLLEQDSREKRILDFTPSVEQIFSPDYEHNHYFTLTYDENGQEVKLRTNAEDQTEEIDSVREYAEEILEGKRTFGRKGIFYYEVKKESGTTTIAFLNCTTEIVTIYRFLLLTTAICFVALVIVFILVYAFSNKIIEPEIENNERQQEFITNASHELKTPLAVIRANTELIEMMNGESEWTQSTLNQVDHMDGLIKNLVLIARSQEKEKGDALLEADVTKAVEQTADTYEAVARQTGKTLKKSLEEGIKRRVDESKVRQLTTILIDNAMKYCDEGGTIEVKLEQAKRDGFTLSVTNDYAEGKDVDYDRFFDRFYRRDQSHNIDKGGYGIGLSIAENICKQFSGTIKAGWENGKITFTCRLRQ